MIPGEEEGGGKREDEGLAKDVFQGGRATE